MRIVLHGTDEPAVTDVDTFTSLDVLVPPGVQQLRGGLGALGTIDDEHAWIDIDQLRQAGRPEDASWATGFDGMIGYARSKGWVSADGTAVRAHLTYPA